MSDELRTDPSIPFGRRAELSPLVSKVIREENEKALGKIELTTQTIELSHWEITRDSEPVVVVESSSQ